jgi:hypothetical protein
MIDRGLAPLGHEGMNPLLIILTFRAGDYPNLAVKAVKLRHQRLWAQGAVAAIKEDTVS